ncbi:MAG: DUF3054 domain-containing protein [Acidimicrobiales bacterium]
MARVTRRWRGAWRAWDAASVVVFVVLGRRVHDHGVRLSGVAHTAWPFAAGLVVGWFVAGGLGWRAGQTRSGYVIATATVVVGMLLRVVSGQGTAVAFVAVAVGFFALLTVAPRALAWRARGRWRSRRR